MLLARQPTPPHMRTLDRSCPLCGQYDAAPQAQFCRDEWQVVRCSTPGCHLVYLRNPPDYATLQEEFPWEKTAAAERSRRRKERRAYYLLSDSVKAIRRLINGAGSAAQRRVQRESAGGDVLDIGCGHGGTLFEIAAGGRFRPHGIEISKALAAEADAVAKPLGGRVTCADALSGLQQLPAASMDAVLMHSFLEHEVAPVSVCREAGRVLRPNGVLVVKVPNFDCWSRKLRGADWPGFRWPDHVNYFTPDTLRSCIQRAGLRVRSFGVRDRLPTSDNMWLCAAPASAT